MSPLKKFFDAYTQRISASFVYAILSAIAMKFFFLPGNVYSSGVNGIAQLIGAESKNLFSLEIPVALIIWTINLPLFFLAWLKIGRKFTIFTILTVTLSVIFMNLIPEKVLTKDHIINAIFGGAINGIGIGYALKNGLSSGGLDIVSLTVSKKTGNNVGIISMGFNAVIVCLAGLFFGWRFALYTILTILVSGRVTDAVFTKQKKMQVMIVTKEADKVAGYIQEKLKRGATIIRSAEGAYTHSTQAVIITVVTASEIPELKRIMHSADQGAFVSIQDNVKIMGNFYEEEF